MIWWIVCLNRIDIQLNFTVLIYLINKIVLIKHTCENFTSRRSSDFILKNKVLDIYFFNYQLFMVKEHHQFCQYKMKTINHVCYYFAYLIY